MTDLILAKVGEKNGLPLYSPMEEEDVKTCAGKDVLVVKTVGDRAKRTVLQNASIHKYCLLLANQFNDAGLDMKAVLKIKTASVDWTMVSVKEVIWRPIQVAMFDKESSTKLETGEVSKVYEQIAKHLSENLNITQSFPSRHGD